MLINKHFVKIDRLKVVLAENEKTNKWLAEKLGKSRLQSHVG